MTGDEPRLPKRRPDGVDDATVEAVRSVSMALEWVERTRGARDIFVAEMKEDRRSNGRPGHEAGPVGDRKEPT